MTPFGHAGTSGDMVGSFWLNMDLGGPPGTRVMTIFGFYVKSHFAKIEYFEVYGGLQAPGGISFLFLLNFPSNASESCLGNDFCPEL